MLSRTRLPFLKPGDVVFIPTPAIIIDPNDFIFGLCDPELDLQESNYCVYSFLNHSIELVNQANIMVPYEDGFVDKMKSMFCRIMLKKIKTFMENNLESFREFIEQNKLLQIKLESLEPEEEIIMVEETDQDFDDYFEIEYTVTGSSFRRPPPTHNYDLRPRRQTIKYPK